MTQISRLKEFFEHKDGCIYWLVARNSRGGLTEIGSRAGYVAPNGYRYVGVDGKRLLEHRVIFALIHGRWPANSLDHINRIPTDNRPENLRECTHAENLQNTKLRSDNSTGVKGVSWDKSRNLYAAELIVNGKKKYLGRFKTLEEAAFVRAGAVAKFHPFSAPSHAHRA